jgi:hypothetical protein
MVDSGTKGHWNWGNGAAEHWDWDNRTAGHWDWGQWDSKALGLEPWDSEALGLGQWDSGASGLGNGTMWQLESRTGGGGIVGQGRSRIVTQVKQGVKWDLGTVEV